MWDGHANVKIASTAQIIAYLFNYTFKGNDKADEIFKFRRSMRDEYLKCWKRWEKTSGCRRLFSTARRRHPLSPGTPLGVLLKRFESELGDIRSDIRKSRAKLRAATRPQWKYSG